MSTAQHDTSPLVNHSRIIETCLKPARAALERTLISLRSDQAHAIPILIESMIRLQQIGALWQFFEGRLVEMGEHFHNLVNMLHKCYDSTGDDQLLVQAISLARESHSLHPPGHVHHASSCTHLAYTLKKRYQNTGNDQLLVEITEVDRELLSLCPPGHPEHRYSCDNLAQTLEIRYQSNGDDQLIIEAINLRREVLSSYPLGHSDRVGPCTNLIDSLKARYRSIRDDQFLIEAINIGRELLSLCPRGHPDREISCKNLAHSLQMRYGSTGDEQLLIESINLWREVLSLCPPGHKYRAWACTHLALLLKSRHTSTGDDQLIIETIQIERESLSLRPPGHPDREVSCTNLALSLWTHYGSTGDDQLLIESIDLRREVLSLCPPGHEHRARACINMALSLKTRYGSTGDEQLLVQAIDLERESLFICPQGHEYHLLSRMNLGHSLKICYGSNGDDQLLVEAIDHERASLSLCPPGHPDRAYCCANLASSLKTRYKSAGDDKLLIEAIHLQRESMSLWPPKHAERATLCTNLANSLRAHYESIGNRHILDEIHTLCQEGRLLEHRASRMWRLFSILIWLHLQPETAFFNPSTAIQFCSQGLEHHPDIASEAISAQIANLDRIWDVADKLCATHQADMVTVYKRLIGHLPFLINPVLDIESQLRALRLCSRIGPDACINAILAEEHSLGLEALETAQGMVWAQRLNYRDPQLTELPVELANKLESLLKAIAVPGTSANAPAKDRIVLTSRDVQHNRVTSVYALLQEIRAIPGLERFMLGEAYSELRSTASKHPVVVLVGARGYFYAILLKTEEQQCSLMPLTVTEKDLSNSCFINHAPRSTRGTQACNEEEMDADDNRGLKMSRPSQSTSTSQRMRYLWVSIVKPVLDQLGVQPSNSYIRPRLHWCLTGAFTSLPLHAAGIYDGLADQQICCTDYVVSSYTPTLTTLLRAQRAVVPPLRDSLHVALIAEKQAHESHLEIIPQVDAEVDLIATVMASCKVQKRLQLTGNTTISSACEAMRDANVVHLACHGVQNSDNALQSGFCLGDGRLTISKLMDLKLDNAFLAFLSACETAKGDKNQPDQVMHLAAAMMFAGFKTVIATMWAINDYDGPKVAKWFYEELFANEVIDGDAVACSLDTAVRKLRELGVSLDRWAPFIHMGV